ncbi:MAG: hypothetical protein WC027_02440 [Candidatus Paceibacterota bacterium]
MKELILVVAFLVAIGLLARRLSGNWSRALQVTGGWGLYEFLGWFYDYPFWGFMVIWLGNLWGSVICSVGALIINFFVLRWYQRTEKDWLGVNILEEIKEKGHGWAEKLCHHPKWYVKWSVWLFAKGFQILIRCLNKNDVLAFIFLSVWKDSFVTTAFLRHGRFSKLETKDYIILVASTIVSVVCWSLGVIVVLQAAKGGWRLMVG